MSTRCICLVVNSSRGHHIVHYHPNSPTLDPGFQFQWYSSPTSTATSTSTSTSTSSPHSLPHHFDISTSIPILTSYNTSSASGHTTSILSSNKPILSNLRSYTDEPTPRFNPSTSTMPGSSSVTANTNMPVATPLLLPTPLLTANPFASVPTSNNTISHSTTSTLQLPSIPMLTSLNPSSTSTTNPPMTHSNAFFLNPNSAFPTSNSSSTTTPTITSHTSATSNTSTPIHFVASQTLPGFSTFPSMSAVSSPIPNSTPAPTPVPTPALPLPSTSSTTPPSSSSSSTPLFGIDPYLLSDFLSPKPSHCDKRFELQMNQFVFIGLPVSLTGQKLAKRDLHFPIAPYYQRRISRYQPPRTSSNVSIPTNATAGSYATGYGKGERTSTYEDFKPPLDMFSPHLAPPTSVVPPMSVSPENEHKFFINMFHLVFIVQEQGPSTPFYLNQLYTNIIQPLTLALQHEQLCREYVRSEAELILSIKDEYSHHSSFVMNHTEPLSQKLLKVSSLVQLMDKVLHCIQHREVIHLVINHHLHLTLQLPEKCVPTPDSILKIEGVELEDEQDMDFFVTLPSLFPFTPLYTTYTTSSTPCMTPTSTSFGSSSVSCCSNLAKNASANTTTRTQSLCDRYFPIIKPFQSLAWVESKEKVLKELTTFGTPALIEFIKWFEPIYTFEDAHVQLRKPLHQILRYAAHLIFWQKAKLIDVISPRKAYVLNPDFPLSHLSWLSLVFQQRFPSLSLLDILSTYSCFSSSCMGGSSSKASKTSLKDVNVLHFLLSFDVIQEFHHYIYLKIPWFIQLGLSLQSFEQLCGAEGQGVLNAASGMSGPWPRPEERKTMLKDGIQPSEYSWINLIAKMHPYQSTFEKVSIFFNGRYHIDEISYRTGVTKKELKTILALYSSELVVLQHPWR